MRQVDHRPPSFFRLLRWVFRTCACIVCGWLLVPVLQAVGAQRPVIEQTRTVRLPVIDGNDIRFRRLSTATGPSQTRVAQIVQDNQGFLWFGTQ